jgi:signal transduction histidine kinase
MAIEKKSKILLVDDDPLNILILEEILGGRYILSKAASAEEAISVAAKSRPDLILLDIMMPGANGFEVCRQLRKNQHLKFTKIILVSAKTLLKDRLEGYKAGADDFISKPFDPDELLAKVRIFIRLKSVEEVDRVKDDLINLFSHETRTPMNAVIGFAKFLRESPNLAEEEREGVDLIVESATNLLQLINKTLLLSSLREENRALSMQAVALGSLVEPIEEKYGETLKKRNLRVETRIDNEMQIAVDPELAHTAISYVFDNAVRFSPDGGCITFEGKCESDRFLLTVSDEGPGIAEERLDDLFDEFGIEDVSHHGRGHGLSLSIVKHIMENHDGEVRAANRSDRSGGAVFSLVFPLASS